MLEYGVYVLGLPSSSRGLGRYPFKVEIRGSNPRGGTKMGAESLIYNEPKENLKNTVTLIAGTGNLSLSNKIGEILGINVNNPISTFPEGEVYCQLSEGLRRKHSIIIQSFTPGKINDQLMEVLILIDAAKRASAQEITVVLPYYPYARQDRKDKPRVPITAALVTNMLSAAGANRIVTLSLHAEQIMGVFNGPWDNLYASYTLIPEIRKTCEQIGIADITNQVALLSPDAGGVKRSAFYAKKIGCNYGVIPKVRDANTLETEQSEILANFPIKQIKAAFIIDDLIAGGGTTCKAGKILNDKGINYIFGVAEHALFLGDALENISNSNLKGIITTDTINHRDEVLTNSKIRIVSVAPLLAEAIKYIHTGESIGEKLIL